MGVSAGMGPGGSGGSPAPSRRRVLGAGPGLVAALGVVSTALPSAAAHASDGEGDTGGASTLRILPYLSAEGAAAHAGVATGALFAVDADDLAAVRAGVAATHDVVTVGLTDDVMAAAPLATAFSADLGATLGDAVLAAGAVLLGAVLGVRSGVVPTVRILLGTAATGTYVPVGPAVTVPADGGAWGDLATVERVHVLRRDPTPTVGAVHLGCVGATRRTSVGTGTAGTFRYAGATTVDGSTTYTAWSAEFANPPLQQYLVAIPR